jgi:hypothetical protein
MASDTYRAVLARSTFLYGQHASMDIRNHRVGIHNHSAGICNHRVSVRNDKVGIDRQFGLKGAAKFVNVQQDQLNVR